MHNIHDGKIVFRMIAFKNNIQEECTTFRRLATFRRGAAFRREAKPSKGEQHSRRGHNIQEGIMTF